MNDLVHTTRNPAVQIMASHPIINRSGPAAAKHFVEYFAVTIRNANTRQAYLIAIISFLDWVERLEDNVGIANIQPLHIAAYIEQLQNEKSIASTKLALAAIRNMYGWLVTKQVVPVNPAADVKGPKRSLGRGKTLPVDPVGMRALFESIKLERLIDYRDRALIGVMVFTTARVSAAISLKLNDLFVAEYSLWLRLTEKGGKIHEVPANDTLAQYIDEYRNAAQLITSDNRPLFQGIPGRSNQLSGSQLTRSRAFDMVRRRAQAAGLDPALVCNHSFRTTGINAVLQAGGSLSDAQKIAAHADISTTKLYDRSSDAVTRSIVEQIKF